MEIYYCSYYLRRYTTRHPSLRILACSSRFGLFFRLETLRNLKWFFFSLCIVFKKFLRTIGLKPSYPWSFMWCLDLSIYMISHYKTPMNLYDLGQKWITTTRDTIKCWFAAIIWYDIFRWFGLALVLLVNPIMLLEIFCFFAKNEKASKGLLLIWLWAIWTMRNEIIFYSFLFFLYKLSFILNSPK